MDFSLSEEQQAIADLAAQILTDKATNEAQRELERSGTRFDPDLWRAVADAGLLGVPVPERHGGGGLGFLEVAAILEHVGRTTAPVPILETLVLGALPVARFGGEALQERWLPPVARGDAVLTAALVGDAPVTASADGDGHRLSGVRLFVPYGAQAHAVLVPADTDAGKAFFLVETGADGLSHEDLVTTSGQPEVKLRLDGVRVGPDARLGAAGSTRRTVDRNAAGSTRRTGDRNAAGNGGEIADWITLRANAALCMVTLGACEAALDLTSEYVKTRKQFDQPIAMFQAVGHRAADAYIDTEAIRLTAWQAAWRVGEGLDARRQVAVAKFFASEAAKRVVHAAQHLHGGIGVDREYPLHRYFLHARQLELTLGSGTPQLLELGRLLAAEPQAARRGVL